MAQKVSMNSDFYIIPLFMKTSDNKCQGIREKVATTINLAGLNKQKVQKAADAKE